jgi:hypothetical protein
MDRMHPCRACSGVYTHTADCPTNLTRLAEIAALTIARLSAMVNSLQDDRYAAQQATGSLALDVWHATHGYVQGMPPLDTPCDRAELLAAVRALREERDALRAALAARTTEGYR